MTTGGFLCCDGWGSVHLKSLDEAVEEALASQGIGRAELQWTTLPNEHPMYHCFFDFDGPPAAWRDYYINHPEYDSYDPSLLNPVIRGVVLDGRLAAIISEKNYTVAWGQFGLNPWWTELRLEDMDPTRPLQFAVNIVVFALTQEGSITHQLMETVQ